MRIGMIKAAAMMLMIAGSAVAEPVGDSYLYQGRLTHNGVLADGIYDFRYQFFTDPVDTGPISTIFLFADDVEVTNGLFDFLIDSDPFFYGNADAFWIELAVYDDAIGDYVVLSPRRRVYPVPHAVESERAVNAQLLEGMDSSDFLPSSPYMDALDGVISNGEITRLRSPNGANVLNVENGPLIGVGTALPRTTLHIGTGSDASLSDTSGFFLTGSVSGQNIVMDDNEIQSRNNGSTSPLYLNNEGGHVAVKQSLTIGQTSNPSPYSFRVDASRSSGPIAYIRNSSTGTNSSGLRIELESNPFNLTDDGFVDENASFVAFFGREANETGGITDDTDPSGEIRATKLFNIFTRVNSTGVSYDTRGADFAEYVERLDKSETLRPGDVIGLYNGKASLRTKGASRVMVVSQAPAFVGNKPGNEEEAANRVLAAFLGQVNVRVTGEVELGDWLVPSGNDDGTAIGLQPDEMEPDQIAQVLGRVWHAPVEYESERWVKAAVGLKGEALTLASIQAERAEETERRLRDVEARLAQIEKHLDKLGAVPVAAGQ